MRYYLKRFADGVEYTPVGREIDKAKIEAGFEIVDAIPQDIRDKEPGGKDYQPPTDEVAAKLTELDTRLRALESTKEKA